MKRLMFAMLCVLVPVSSAAEVRVTWDAVQEAVSYKGRLMNNVSGDSVNFQVPADVCVLDTCMVELPMDADLRAPYSAVVYGLNADGNASVASNAEGFAEGDSATRFYSHARVYTEDWTTTGERGVNVDGNEGNLGPYSIFSTDPTNNWETPDYKPFATAEVWLGDVGPWYVWARMKYFGGGNDANSFFIRIDNGSAMKLGNSTDTWNQWHWNGKGNMATGLVPIPIGPVSIGAHRIEIIRRETEPDAPLLNALFFTTFASGMIPDDEGLIEALEVVEPPTTTTTTTTTVSTTTTTAAPTTTTTTTTSSSTTTTLGPVPTTTTTTAASSGPGQKTPSAAAPSTPGWMATNLKHLKMAKPHQKLKRLSSQCLNVSKCAND